MSFHCARCLTPVVYTNVSEGYFAVCPEHDEDLYSIEVGWCCDYCGNELCSCKDPNINEHKDYMCGDCGSTWVRYEHTDGKDCDNTCDDPCLIRMCNEEDCIGNAIMVGV